MPRELITIQVGQCGNQIGHRFWELALREHAANNSAGLFDEAMSRCERRQLWCDLTHSQLSYSCWLLLQLLQER